MEDDLLMKGPGTMMMMTAKTWAPCEDGERI
jgi:hypothetical protein